MVNETTQLARTSRVYSQNNLASQDKISNISPCNRILQGVPAKRIENHTLTLFIFKF